LARVGHRPELEHFHTPKIVLVRPREARDIKLIRTPGRFRRIRRLLRKHSAGRA
jgi:hypothetical protein